LEHLLVGKYLKIKNVFFYHFKTSEALRVASMLQLQHASIGGAEVLLLLKVPAEGQSITCGINFSSAHSSAAAHDKGMLVVTGHILAAAVRD